LTNKNVDFLESENFFMQTQVLQVMNVILVVSGYFMVQMEIDDMKLAEES
jgi:hypothetical protein